MAKPPALKQALKWDIIETFMKYLEGDLTAMKKNMKKIRKVSHLLQ